MNEGQQEFHKRLGRLVRKHEALSRGYVTGMRPDGLIVARPCAARPWISGRAVLLLLVAFFVLKSLLLAGMDMSAYNKCIANMRDGTVLEKAGALVMQPDPLSQMIASEMRRILR